MNQHEGRDRFEIPKSFDIPQNMKDFAEAGFDQARKAFENFMSAAQKTASTFEDQGQAAQASAKELSGKAVGFAEANVRASLDHAERLLKAKDMHRSAQTARRAHPGADARSGRAGERNGTDHDARGDGRNQAQIERTPLAVPHCKIDVAAHKRPGIIRPE